MSGSRRREMEQLVREMRKAGWKVEKTRSGHWKFMPPGGKGGIYAPSTPGDARSLDNTKAELKRALRAKSQSGVAISKSVSQ